MTNILQSKYKSSRRLGTSLWGSDKDAFNKRNYPPGQHGRSSVIRHSTSDFREHLLAVQLVRLHYGRVNARQFKNIFLKAKKIKGNVAENFAGLLERRLDVVVYRVNFAPTIFAARQLVSHGHILLNDKKIDISSIILKENDVITLKSKSRNLEIYKNTFSSQERKLPNYLEINENDFSGKFIKIPSIDEIPYPFVPDFSKIVEYYSR
ncbi:MAG: 30S ribosomal protein S4 [Rickettsia sp.]|nr:30S ribosomal protein S4 [Rickettsia sp.]